MRVQRHELNGQLEHIDMLGVSPMEGLTIMDALELYVQNIEQDKADEVRAYRILEKMRGEE